MSTILIGVDDSPRSEDAVAFAAHIARAANAHVVLAGAFPYEDVASRASNKSYREALEHATERTLRRLADRLEDVRPEHLRTVAIASTSPARTLDEAAASCGAELVVVGSTHTSRLGRILPGSTAERMLYGAPCAVAIVPHGYRTRTHAPIRTIGVAYDGTAESDAALSAAAALARPLDAELRVLCIAEPDAIGNLALFGPAAWAEFEADYLRERREQVEHAIAALPAGIRAVASVDKGDAVRELAARSKDLDLLVTGSRGYGPLRAVLLGGVTGRLVREAACPMIVVPRGVESPLGKLFAERDAATA